MEHVTAATLDVRTCAIKAGALVVSSTPIDTSMLGPVWEDTLSFKEPLKGALLSLGGDNYAFVPPKMSFTTNRAGDKVLMVNDGSTSAHEQTKEWFTANVKEVFIPGFITVGTSSGKDAPSISVGGIPATITPTAGSPMTDCVLTYGGKGKPMKITEALNAIGKAGSARPIEGVGAAAAMVSIPGVPTPAEAGARDLGMTAVVGGTIFAARRASTLVALGVGTDPTGDVNAGDGQP